VLLAKVKGTVVSSNKVDSITGTTYLLVQLCDQREKLGETFIVALDLVGAGVGEVVIIAQGSSARQTKLTFEKPIDAVVVGIVDLVEEMGKVAYRKQC
jgi:microcompartment protein CcmK/EutM